MIKLTLTSGRPLYLAAGEVACVFEPAEGNSRVGLRHVGPGNTGAFIVKETPAEVDALVDEALGEDADRGIVIVREGEYPNLMEILRRTPANASYTHDGRSAEAMVKRKPGGRVVVNFTLAVAWDPETALFDGWADA